MHFPHKSLTDFVNLLVIFLFILYKKVVYI